MNGKTPFIDTARDVIRAEADALGTLADSLDSSFRAAVDLLLNAHGRVIVTGIGKSGHIARKVAATLASTGTPAQFVNPAEALGDALAVALMNHRAFTAEHFRDFHPGGKLGAQLSRVSDLMHAGDAMPLVTRDTAMSDALIEISR